MSMSNSPFSFLERLRADTHQDPVRDWLVLLIFSIIALAGIVLWNVWAFDTVANGGAIGADTTVGPAPVMNRLMLDTIHDTFEQRAVEEAKYENGTYRYADPSQ